MKRLAELIDHLERHTSLPARTQALTDHLASVPPASAGWMVAIALGQGPARIITAHTLGEWASEASGHEDWMIAACYEVVGDVCETLALLLDHGRASHANAPLHSWIEQRLLPAAQLDPPDEAALKASVLRWWATLDAQELLILNRLLTGTLKIPAPHRALVLALAAHTKLDAAWIEHRLALGCPPGEPLFAALTEEPGAHAPRPYPLDAPATLAWPAPLDDTLAADTLAHRWHDGLRAELVKRGGAIELWAEDGQRLTERFPDLVAAASDLPDDTALDGQIVGWDARRDVALGMDALTRRVSHATHKAPSKRLVKEAPAAYIAHDLLELRDVPQRDQPLSTRLTALTDLLTDTRAAILADALDATPEAIDEAIRTAHAHHLRGVLLRDPAAPLPAPASAAHGLITPARMTCIAVLMYVRGRGAGSEHSFGVWDGPQLTRIASIKGAMTTREAQLIELWARAHTTQRFGPVREVDPHHVYELSYDGTLPSKRHRAGFELRDVRLVRKRDDIVAARADTLATLAGLNQQ
jgi:DNA ligase 1